MTIQHQLDGFLRETESVSVAAFGDLSSGLILKSAVRSSCPREVLDQMGAKAAEVFARLATDRVAPDTGLDGIAVHFTETSLHLFLRAPHSGEDMLCLALKPGSPIAPVLAPAAALAGRLAGTP